MADALVLTTERDNPDAIVDIATLTGAALRALGTGWRPSSAMTRRWSIR